MRIWLLLCVFASLGACTTAPAYPAISDFAGAVHSTSKAVEKRYVRDDIAGLLANEYDEAIVDRLAFFQSDDCSAPISLSVDLDDPALSDFSEHCSFDTREVVDGEIRPAEIIVSDGLPGITGESAQRLSSSLGAYAEALGELAQSDAPEQLERDFDSAAAAVLNLVDDAKTLGERGEALTRPERALAEAGSGAASSLLRGYFETRRFRLLHELVEKSDPSVQLASRAIAGWYRAEASGEILAAYDAFDQALSRHQQAIAALRAGNGSRDDAITATREARLAYDELALVEATAPWRVHLAVAEAHAAMLDAFASPANIEALAEANDRIENLVRKAVIFVEAVDAVKQENER